MPDYFQGQPVDAALLRPMTPQKSDPVPSAAEKEANGRRIGPAMGAFHSRQPLAKNLELMDETTTALRADPSVTKIGAVGFCKSLSSSVSPAS